MTIRPRRSLLYVPASNTRAIDKARTLPCDGVILDLEDAVAPEEKENARANAVRVVQEGGFGHREVIVRVNGQDTPWGAGDLRAIAAAGPDAVLVPKVSDPDDIGRYDAMLSAAPQKTRLWAMIETTRALFRLDALAAQGARTRLACWVMGTNDLAKEMRATLDAGRAPFLAALSMAVAAARAYGLDILDGVFNELDQPEAFEAQCRQGLAFGFDGKTLIHPNQVGPCNKVFTPTEAELEAAAAVVTAFELPENQSKGAIRVAGRMVERLHLEQARRVIAVREAIGRAATMGTA